MSLTPTTQIPLGFQAPEFSLTDTISGNTVSLDQFKNKKGLVVIFMCNHCPYVKYVLDGIIQLGRDYIPKEIGFVAISSNDVENYPEDSPEQMQKLGVEKKFPFPYLYDESQEIAKKYHAACTPDFDVFDADMKCVYRGQMDDARPGNNIPVTGKNLRNVLDNILEGKAITGYQKPSVGCSIKWK